jgi:hypothetical protein
MLSIIDVKGLSFMDLGKVKRLLGLYMQVGSTAPLAGCLAGRASRALRPPARAARRGIAMAVGCGGRPPPHGHESARGVLGPAPACKPHAGCGLPHSADFPAMPCCTSLGAQHLAPPLLTTPSPCPPPAHTHTQVDAQFYPETLGRLLIINAPSWFASSFQLVKQFMDPNTQVGAGDVQGAHRAPAAALCKQLAAWACMPLRPPAARLASWPRQSALPCSPGAAGPPPSPAPPCRPRWGSWAAATSRSCCPRWPRSTC